MSDYIEATPQGTLIKLLVQPRASRTAIGDVHGEPPRLKLRVAAPPVDGEANQAVLDFLKKRLRVPASSLSLVRGETSRQKDVLCTHLTIDAVRELLMSK